MKARVSSADSYHPHQMLRRATRSPLGFEISPAFEFDWFYHLVRSPQPWTLFLGMHRVYRVCLIYCTKFPCFFPRLRFSITSRILFFFFFNFGTKYGYDYDFELMLHYLVGEDSRHFPRDWFPWSDGNPCLFLNSFFTVALEEHPKQLHLLNFPLWTRKWRSVVMTLMSPADL